MSELITCIECGKKISSNVTLCIHCGKHPKYRGRCFICNKVTKFSEKDIVNYGTHQKCLDSFIKNEVHSDILQFSCETCHTVLEYENFSMNESRSHCPKCGESLYFYQCDFCSKITASHAADRITIYNSLPLDDDYLYFHPSCCSFLCKHNPYKDRRYSIDRNKARANEKKACFIATAVYGSPLEPQVIFLKEFRDTKLSSFELGRQLISLYYKYSPAISFYIEERSFLKKFIRHGLLEPLIWGIKKMNRSSKK